MTARTYRARLVDSRPSDLSPTVTLVVEVRRNEARILARRAGEPGAFTIAIQENEKSK